MDIHKTYSGKEFNELNLYPVYKLTNILEIHNEFQFQDGLNIDTIEFNPHGECQKGGIYFCSVNCIRTWIKYNGNQMFWIRDVTISDDAQVYTEINKYKADKIILGARRSIFDDSELCKMAVMRDGLMLKYVTKQINEKL